MIKAEFEKNFNGWRTAARGFLTERIKPEHIIWNDEVQDLFSQSSNSSTFLRPDKNLTVPREFMSLAENVAASNDESRWSLLYRLLFRLLFENPNLLSIHVDPDIHRAMLLAHSVRRDVHKMHAFVRFKLDIIDGEEVYRAWHRPEHPCLQLAAPFFERRFGDKRWSIFTPDESAHWDLKELTYGPGMEQHQFQTRDGWDEIWKTYYKSIYNPARLNIKMMKQEMSPKYWSSMPETELIRDLIRESPARLQKMARDHHRAADVDMSASLSELTAKAATCQACPLYGHATQTVFGAGNPEAKIMIVGEQPGEHEDQMGAPFVGPAGEVLNQALSTAGLERSSLYLTNAVKHFKWTRATDGKSRLHKKASGHELHACKPWLEAEIARVKPKIIVALGATAGTAVLGRLPKIADERGRIIESSAAKVIMSWHPASILRSEDQNESATRSAQLAADLRMAGQLLASLK